MKTSRRRAREFIVQGLYQAQLNSELTALTIVNNLQDNDSFKKADQDLFTKAFYGSFNNQPEYMAIIMPLLDRDEEDVSPIEKAVLLMATHELKNMPETPYPVIINEAIELNKTFGSNEGYKFINGILDKLAAQLRPNDPPRQ